MAVTVTEQADFRGLPQEIYASGQPVTAAVHAEVEARVGHLYEAVWDEALPPNTVATQPGHMHQGQGTGHSLPRLVLSANYSLPIWESGDSADPVSFPFGTTNSGNVYSANSAAIAQHYSRYVQANNATTVAESGSYQILAYERLRLAPGCKGVKVVMWRGTVIAGSPATEVTWRVWLRAAATTTGASLTEYDGAEETIDTSENARWLTLPRTTAEATAAGGDYASAGAVNGEQSGDSYLACMTTAGEVLPASADPDGGTDFDLCVAVSFSDATNASIAYLYALRVYEVPYES